MRIPTGENLIPIPMGMGIPMGIPIPTATLLMPLHGYWIKITQNRNVIKFIAIARYLKSFQSSLDSL